ncbi:hypothetical protein [Streptomyces leeuwenhoekii]|uniref:hypothetical protein n=1 Tax=Streptomyces leeuwenhoekii TaxID=1437453 RepID=UPI00131DBFE2|nr:hypothetical protein [Streptomyces leeuwenhoekii]
MAHRPYPDAARALRQILRRHRNQMPAARVPQGPAGEYRLSTRRPSVVGAPR